MNHTLKKWLVRLKGARPVKLNRFFHAFFMLSKKELRATEKVCREDAIYESLPLERYC